MSTQHMPALQLTMAYLSGCRKDAILGHAKYVKGKSMAVFDVVHNKSKGCVSHDI